MAGLAEVPERTDSGDRDGTPGHCSETSGRSSGASKEAREEFLFSKIDGGK